MPAEKPVVRRRARRRPLGFCNATSLNRYPDLKAISELASLDLKFLEKNRNESAEICGGPIVPLFVSQAMKAFLTIS
jgi:hypothetical protein